MRNDKSAMRNDLRYLVLVLLSLMVAGLCLWPIASLSQGPTGIIKVIVDPGHGGQDTGGKDTGGLAEKNITLTLANNLVQLLETTGTVRVVLTRTDDYKVSLDDRAGLANHRGGDLLISLHVGDFFAPVPSGYTLYYWSPTISSPIVSTPSDKGQPWDQEQQPYSEQSRKLATLMQQELGLALPWSSGGVLQADLYLLRRVRMPAVLLELGSLNYPEEAAALQKPGFNEIVARALAEAIIKFRNMKEKELLAPQPKKEELGTRQ